MNMKLEIKKMVMKAFREKKLSSQLNRLGFIDFSLGIVMKGVVTWN